MSKLILSTIVTIFLFGSLGLLFTNCSGLKPSAQAETAQMNTTEIASALKLVHKSSLNTSFCKDSANYSCSKKVFSPHVQNESYIKENPLCVTTKSMDDESVQLCPELKLFSYNSQTAVEVCQQTAGCNESYDYTEYECHLKLSLKADGNYPLVIRGLNYIDVINQVFKNCELIGQD